MPSHRTSLDGDSWRLGQCMHGQGVDDVIRWIPARVPGNVRFDLMRAGIIEDPFPGKQNELSKWVDDWNWWYKRDVDIKPGPKRTFIRFEGIDYRSHIFFNGRKLLDNEGMFAPVTVEITDLISDKNSLCVNVEYSGQFKVREKTLKCQMSFGWDFAPAIKTMGIWDSVSMIRTGDITITHLRVEPVQVTESYWEAQVSLGLDSRKEHSAIFEFELKGHNFEGGNKTHKHEELVPEGVSEHKVAIPVIDPQLWFPWELGKQNLYSLSVAVKTGREVSDSLSAKFGLRTIALHSNEGLPGKLWTFFINGKRMYIRGANWVPPDSLPGRIDHERYSKLLDLAKQANINMLRVWGGGLREKDDFYALCDELGIMLWQEFPFACAHRPYPRDEHFKKLVKKESAGILDKLHNNPSVVLYCGGNEISYSANKPIVEIMKQNVERYGGGRPFKVTSPTEGESHNYRIFHGLANLADYRNESEAFLSEFGCQSAPARETLDFIIPRKFQWPIEPQLPNSIGEFTFTRAEQFDFINRLIISNSARRNTEIWTYHDAQLLKLFRYAEQIGFDDCDSFINATQKIQAQALQIAVEHVRRRRYTTSGVMFWQFNEPWPTVCWSVVDYFFRPKLAWHKLKQIYSPLLFSLDYPLGPYEPGQDIEAGAYLINDKHRDYNNLNIIITTSGDSDEDRKTELEASVVADGITELGKINIALPGESNWKINCDVLQNGKKLCSNEYDLSIVDQKPTIGILMALDWLAHNIFWK